MGIEEIKKHKNEILAIAAKYGAHDVRIFGSFARNQAGDNSDVDFLVQLDPERSLFDLGGLLYDLQVLLHRKVDIVTEKGLHWYIKDSILNEAKPL